MKTPDHYAGKVTPWDLQKCMKSSGDLFVDARRTDAIEYCFRMKDDLLDDLKKARHNLDVAIERLEGGSSPQLEPPQARDDAKDAARYRFLRQQSYRNNYSLEPEPLFTIELNFRAEQSASWPGQDAFSDLDSAIDDAIADSSL